MRAKHACPCDVAMSTAKNNGQERRSTSELIRALSEQSTRLIHQEMALARAELIEKGFQAGLGVGLLGVAAVLSLFALGALTAAGILLLATAMKAWVAALVIAAGILVVAGAAALIGKARLVRATPPVPEAAIQTTRHDVEIIRSSIHKGRT